VDDGGTGDPVDDFWRAVSLVALAAVWDNPDDDVYAELLQD
jgi:hypothetical protein